MRSAPAIVARLVFVIVAVLVPTLAACVEPTPSVSRDPISHDVLSTPSASSARTIDAGRDGALASVANEPSAPPAIERRPPNATCLALASASSPPPEALSKTGCTAPAIATEPAEGLIPYDVNAPLWTDGATKRRWMALPDGQTIHVAADGDFEFPKGTVLVKEFSVGGRRLETRLFMHYLDGSWGGYGYAWDELEVDARLVSDEGEARIDDVNPARSWTFPSRNACLGCHTAKAGYSLGLEMGQLNRTYQYWAARAANQLETLDQIGVFDARLGPAATWPAYARVSDQNNRLEDRARAYLHGNCAGCHRPGGVLGGIPDLRYSTPFSETGLCGAPGKRGNAGGPDGSMLISPGDPAASIVALRLHSVEAYMMPPLGRSLADDVGVGIVDSWIASIPRCPAK